MAFIEAHGLHLRKKWAEWLSVAALSLFIPYEIYEVVSGITVLKTAILVLNSAIVYYLAGHREMFKSKG